MAAAIIEWLLKAAVEYFIGRLVKSVGIEKAKTHILGALANAKPLPPDITPAQARNPNTTDHG